MGGPEADGQPPEGGYLPASVQPGLERGVRDAAEPSAWLHSLIGAASAPLAPGEEGQPCIGRIEPRDGCLPEPVWIVTPDTVTCSR